MPFPTLTPGSVFRDFESDGIPSSGYHEPKKPDIRRLLNEIQDAIIALIAGQGGNIALPNLLIRFSITGGTANAIVATPDRTPPTTPISAFFLMIAEQANTGPMTINGKPLRTNGGEEIAPGEVVASDLLPFVDFGDHYRLFMDPSSLRNKEAAQVAQIAAQVARDFARRWASDPEDGPLINDGVNPAGKSAYHWARKAERARDIAAGYAGDIVSQGAVPLYSTHVGFHALPVPAGIQSGYLWGFYKNGDGGGKQIRRVHGNTVIDQDNTRWVRSGDRFLPDGDVEDEAFGGWWEIAEILPNVRQFGVRLDGISDDCDGWIYALRYASGKCLVSPAGVTLSSKRIPIYPNTKLLCLGAPTPWYANFTTMPLLGQGGVTMVMIGDGQKDVFIEGVTSMSPSGGVVPDPTTGLNHALTSFYNADATDTTAATQRGVSVAIDLSKAYGAQISNLRVVPRYLDGGDLIGGYNNPSNLAWSDAVWDIGFLINDAWGVVLDNCFAVGHWRDAGLATIATQDVASGDASTSAERTKIIGGQFSGKVGYLQRGGDCYAIVAVTSATVTIPWHAQMPLPQDGGKFTIMFGGATATRYTYSSWTKSGDKIVLSEVTPDPIATGVTTSSGLFVGRTMGFQGTELRGVFLSGIEHQSKRLCTDSALSAPMETPSKILEVTGAPAANLRLFGCTLMTQEDCAFHFHNMSNFYDFGSYWESNTSGLQI